MANRWPDRRTEPGRERAVLLLKLTVVVAVVLLAPTGCQNNSPSRRSDATSAAPQRPGSGRAATPSPTALAVNDPQVVLAVQSYEAYLRTQAAALLVRTRPFTDAIRAGDVTAAKERFAASRTCWERIQSVAILLPQIDRRIDARADDFATPTDPAWTGWHRLEHILWTGGSTAGAASLANRLDRDLESLNRALRTLRISPKIMAAGIARLVEEAIAEKLPGAEDRYSRVDLTDLAGNVQGAEAGYSAARPLLTARDAALTRILDGQFAAVDRTISRYRTSAGYRPYPALTPAVRTLMGSQLSTLAEALTGLSGILER